MGHSSPSLTIRLRFTRVYRTSDSDWITPLAFLSLLLQMANDGTSQFSKSHEPIRHNNSPFINTLLALSIWRTLTEALSPRHSACLLLALLSSSAAPLSPNLLPGKLLCFIRTWGQSFPHVLPMGLGRVLGVLMPAAAESPVLSGMGVAFGSGERTSGWCESPVESDEEGIACGLEAKFGHFLAVS